MTHITPYNADEELKVGDKLVLVAHGELKYYVYAGPHPFLNIGNKKHNNHVYYGMALCEGTINDLRVLHIRPSYQLYKYKNKPDTKILANAAIKQLEEKIHAIKKIYNV